MLNLRRPTVAALIGGLMLVSAPQGARAGEVTHTIGDGHSTATMVFNDDGATTTLSILLTNDRTTNDPPQFLVGIFFDIAGSPTLTYTGLGGDGSDAFNDMVTLSGTLQTPYTDVTVDHFWALDQSVAGALNYGLGSTPQGGIFSEAEVLNIQAGGPLPALDGLEGAIVPDIVGLDVPDAQDGLALVLGGLWLTFDLGSYDIAAALVTDGQFVYGNEGATPAQRTSFGELKARYRGE